ncbi:hypothetical protein [uncultured Methanobrevibacter sp.]|uniref:hypothetical protein n=1 Tax=uncultured Methanobrevibacter sp. TaxID=253161 RepID=UPI0025D30E42|nr:hypothetical protein [uncultured Methanobrevibacter sp.]
MTTTLFDFLINFNPEAYEIALQIEDEITTSPASIKTYATTFLECIVDDMLLKSGNKNINPYANFTPKVKKLSMFGVIKYSFETQLINAYKLRNTAHYSLKKTADEDKRLALELYEKLFHIAWRYFEEFGGNEYDYLGKPKFIPPFRENDEKELVEVPHIERMEKIFDHCIICGRKNNSHYHNLCSDCNNKIEHVEDVINMKNHFEGNFTKRNIVDLGYSKPYSDALVRELLNENLILKVDKSYCFNDELFDNYLKEIELYGEIELVLSEFASGKLTLKDIKKSDYYLKGKDSIKPFTQVYKIVSDAIFKEFISQLSLGIEISEIMENTTITEDEIISWYNMQLKMLEGGIKNQDFINYNKISIDSFIKLRAQGKTQKEIIANLHLPEDIVEFWLNTHVKELDYFKESLDDTNMDLILKAISENKTKTEFLDNFDISQDELNCLLDKYPEFNKIYTRDYIIKRRNDFLFYLNENNYENSIEKAHLSKKEVDEWLIIGRKDFELRHPGELCEFYRDTIEKLMKHYVKYRVNALSKGEAARKINQSPKTIDQWLRRDDYEIFINFQKECENITLSVLVNAIKKGLTLKQAAALADMSQNNLIKLIRLGENGDEKYIELYDVYQNKYIPTQLETFLDKIKSSKYKKALKSAHLTEDELNKYYILGLEGKKPFNEFADKYFEFKLENYKKEIIQKGKTESRAARNANFIDKDFELRQKEIDCALVENQLEIITPMVEEGYHAKYIAGKINIDVDVFFNWYVKGYNGDETFKEFAETYWDCRMHESIDDFQSLFDKGISEKFFLKYIIRKNVLPEYKFWKSLGLFEFKNQLLSEEEQFNIIKENVLDVKDNVMKILEAADEDTDLEVPVEELIGEIEDADLKRHVKNFLKKEDDEDG